MTVVIDLMKFVGVDLDNPEKSVTIYETGGSTLTIMGTARQFNWFVDLIRRQMEDGKK